MEYHYYMIDGVLIEIQIEARSVWYDKKYN
jgi:hypothetical protein